MLVISNDCILLILRGGETVMDIFSSIVAPIIVGIVLALFEH
ncbi:type I toxin-antitoxin system Fst family toxin [Lactobacillus helveticus]